MQGGPRKAVTVQIIRYTSLINLDFIIVAVWTVFMMLALKSTWYLVDTGKWEDIPLPSHKAVTILISPLRKSYFDKFIGFPSTAELQVFPMWTIEELECVRSQTCNTTVTSSQLVRSFGICGGIPRLVFNKTESEMLEIMQRSRRSTANARNKDTITQLTDDKDFDGDNELERLNACQIDVNPPFFAAKYVYTREPNI